MNDIILPLAIYIVGVLVSMVLVAFINRKEKELHESVSVLSWIFVLIIIITLIEAILLWPFEKFQNYLNSKFKKETTNVKTTR